MPLKETSEEGYSVYRDPDTKVPKVYVMEVAFQQERDQSHLQSIDGRPAVVFDQPVEVLDFYSNSDTNSVFTVNGKRFTVLSHGGYDPTRIGGVPNPVVFVEGTSEFLLKSFA